MTGRRQVAAAWLRIVADPAPAAYYACQLCPYTAQTRGRDRVADFVRAIRTDHRATCPGLHPERKNA